MTSHGPIICWGAISLVANLNPPEGGTVLEMGCGTGRNLVRVAQRYGGSRIYGFDISDEMLVSAGNAVERNGLLKQVQLAQGDAVTFSGANSFGVPRYDRIYFSYTLSMIPDWTGAIRNGVSLLAPGGELHVVDFGGCGKLPSLFRKALYGWLKKFHVTPRTELLSFAEQLAGQYGLQADYSTSHRGYAQHLVLKHGG